MKRFRDLRIPVKIAFAFAAVLIVTVVSGGVTYLAGTLVDQATVQRSEATRAGDETVSMLVAVRRQESLLRGFLLTGDPAFLGRLDAAKKEMTAHLAAVRKVTDDSAVHKSLSGIERLMTRWSDGIAAKQIRLMRDPDTVEQARAIEVSGAGHKIMNKVNDIAEAVIADQKTRIEASRRDQAFAQGLSVWAVVGGCLLSLSVAACAGLILVRAIGSPITRMTGAMAKLADGDKHTDIPDTDRRDEIGHMADAVAVFRENMIKADSLAAEQAEEQEARAARAEKLRTLTQGFETAIEGVLGRLGEASGGLERTAGEMTSVSSDTSTQATEVAASAQQASANVAAVASAAEELSGSISEIGRQVHESARISNEAAEKSRNTNAKVRDLAASADRIGEVVTLIQAIAEQTNLLALNATIEAARAGEAGKGFAVVASEVKNLANQTAKATEEIGQQVSEIQSETNLAVTSIEEIGETVDRVQQIANAIAAAVEEQDASTHEIASNVQQVSQGTSSVSEGTEGLRDSAERTGSMADDLHRASQTLARESEDLTQHVRKFLTDVRAA
jgi:methyl-accepting chemotaxis protein